MRKTTLNGLILYTLAMLLTSGAPKIDLQTTKVYPPLDYREEVKFFEIQENFPTQGEELGILGLGDTGFTTKCNFQQMVEYAKLEARKIGGNAIKMIDHKKPDLMSTCHQIVVKIYKISDSALAVIKPVASDTLSNNKAEYALLRVYRKGSFGFLISYDLHLGDTVICNVQSNWRKTIRIRKDGINNLWARTEAKEEIPIKITFGNEYYIRCGVGMGMFVGRPTLELVNNDIGKLEYASVKFDGLELPDLLLLNDGREIECKVHGQDSNIVKFSILKKDTEIRTQINKTDVKEIILGE